MRNRERLIRFIKPWADCRRQYVVRIGDCVIPHDWLTDEALAKLAERIRSDFWIRRRHNRINREIYAARRAA